MTVKVTLSDGRLDSYMRFGDAYIKRGDGSLDVIRTGAMTFSYTPREWTGVEGDQKRSKVRLFRRVAI